MNDWKKRLQFLQYPALILLIGFMLVLIPSSGEKKVAGAEKAYTLEEVLSATEGVGRVCVLLSEHGAVIVCDGAESAGVRLDIFRAVGTYTGFGSDRITVLRMTHH